MLRYASVFATPCACCSGPRAVSTMALFARPSRCAASTNRAFGHAGHLFDALGPVGCGQASHLLESLCAIADVLLCDESVPNEHVKQAVGQRQIRARPQRQVLRGPHRRGGSPWIDHDERSAAALLRLEVLQDRRHRFGDVGADEKNDFSVRNVFERKRQPAVQSERGVHGCRGRRHAEAAVVIDVGRAQRHARELAEQVGFFVRQRASAKNAERIASGLPLDVLEGVRRSRRARRPSSRPPGRRRRRAPTAS